MAKPNTATRAVLLSLVEDMEIVSKELMEYLSMSRSSKQDDLDVDQLITLLKMKDEELQAMLKVAQEQAKTQTRFEALKREVEKRDLDIRQLQRSLKDTESLLATAIYQAKQKLQTINQANSRKISSEDLIKYSHKISASNAVAAPPTWSAGDPRRPYPTEIDMRSGLLARLHDLPVSSQLLQNSIGHTGGAQQQQHYMGSSFLTWQPSAEVQSMTVLSGTIAPHCTSAPTMEPNRQQPATEKDRSDDVELMSSDSSSSSSSDE